MPEHAPFKRPAAKRAAPSATTPSRAPDRDAAAGQPAPGPTFDIRTLAVHPPTAEPQPVQRVALPNRTGLPDRLKSGIEALSGLSMDDVRVHRNSAEPVRLGALAYAKGSAIHLAPGQERHLPHETWHLVQQKQGRVRATGRLGRGTALNDDSALEAEADRMGRLAAAPPPGASAFETAGARQATPAPGRRGPADGVVQRVLAVQGSDDYRAAVRVHIATLANVHVDHVAIDPNTGQINLPAPGHGAAAGHQLLHRIAASPHQVIVRPAQPNEPAQAEPHGPSSRMQRVGDFARDMWNWRPWGTSRRLRHRAAAAQGGVGSVIPYNHQLPAGDRHTPVLPTPAHPDATAEAPQEIMLGHELVHADRFQRGRGAFNAAGGMTTGNFDYQGRVGPPGVFNYQNRQGAAYHEEIATIGLPLSAAQNLDPAPAPDANPITENTLRQQLNARLRNRY